MKRIYLSLGSNRGDRAGTIRNALELLHDSGLEVVRVSSFYRTQPVDFTPQPWFVNCVAELQTGLLPLKLLHACKAVERALGRRPGVAKGPRVIDIDILLYEDIVIRSAELTVPHPRMGGRRFVLVPLKELAPDLRHPVTGQTVVEMLHDSQDHSQVVKLQTP
ncbi:MAG TPA: 2-amino-4-hydroxy-6-hydroxymethyldihydropteridine diphosphokinase [Terriglobia bacterium]|nr:2-amino-4-hydroxy-6-hydroxymethyldihydropteridine diphosphokinase [Terriglobia bacterium]